MALGAVGGSALWERLLRDHVDDHTGAPAPAGGSASLPGAAPSGRPRVLVVLQCNGGNDGLNTLVPAAGAYHDLRPELAIAEKDRVAIGTEGFALHPSLAPLRSRWQAGQVLALDGIAMPQQSRSHFTAMDTWWSATPGAASTTGWLGRWLDRTEAATPDPLRAIALGAGSPALVGERSLPTVVLDPAAFALRAPRGSNAAAITDAFLATAAPLAGEPALAAAQRAVPDAIAAIHALERVRASGGTAAKAGSIEALLDVAAGVVELGIGTRVVLVTVGGFDTHADQLTRQQALLGDLATGVDRFFSRLESSGHASEVLLVTTSEFGRRAAQNASGGTDHGNASVQFVAGPAVKGGRVVGGADLTRLVDGDLAPVLDTRSLYAVALDWLGGPTDEVLGGSFDRYGVL